MDARRHPFDDETESGGSFVVGLLAGTVLGAGLAMIFGPKASLPQGDTRETDRARELSQTPPEEGDPVLGPPPTPNASENAAD